MLQLVSSHAPQLTAHVMGDAAQLLIRMPTLRPIPDTLLQECSEPHSQAAAVEAVKGVAFTGVMVTTLVGLLSESAQAWGALSLQKRPELPDQVCGMCCFILKGRRRLHHWKFYFDRKAQAASLENYGPVSGAGGCFGFASRFVSRWSELLVRISCTVRKHLRVWCALFTRAEDAPVEACCLSKDQDHTFCTLWAMQCCSLDILQ